MSFKFINNIGNEPAKKDKVVKTYESKYDSNNIERNMDIGLERLKRNIILKYKNWGGHNVDGFNISFKPFI